MVELDDRDRVHLEALFIERIFPVLTPLSVDPAHPFPYISSLSLNLAALVRDPSSGERRFARVKVPPLLPRFIEMPDGERFVPIEQVIAAHLEVLFPGMEIVGHSSFRLTRDADFELEEEEGGISSKRSSPFCGADSEVRRRFGSSWTVPPPMRFESS